MQFDWSYYLLRYECLFHLIDLRPESAWSLRMNPWKNETSSTKVLRFPFVKCTRPDGLKLLQIRMICNLQVELARSIGAKSFKILLFSPTNNSSGHPEIHIFVLGLEVFGRFHKKIGGLEVESLLWIIKCAKSLAFFLWLWNMKTLLLT